MGTARLEAATRRKWVTSGKARGDHIWPRLSPCRQDRGRRASSSYRQARSSTAPCAPLSMRSLTPMAKPGRMIPLRQQVQQVLLSQDEARERRATQGRRRGTMGQPPITDYRSTSSMPPLAAILAGAGAAGHDDGGDTLMDESNAVIDFIRASKLEAFKDAFVKLIARRLASCDLCGDDARPVRRFMLVRSVMVGGRKTTRSAGSIALCERCWRTTARPHLNGRSPKAG